MTGNICSILWLIFLIVWVVTWLRTKRAQERAPLSSRLLYGIPIGIGAYLMSSHIVLFAWGQTHILPRTALLDAIAILLTAAGISFAIWARFYLGENWSSAVTIKVEHELIRTGPYAWVRHPIYCGLLIALVGTGLARDQLIAVPAVAMFWLGFWIKSRMEERFMRKAFGDRYIEYSKSTGALLPKLRTQSHR